MYKEQIFEAVKKLFGEDPMKWFTLAADFWNAYLSEKCVSPGADVCVMPEDVAAMMCLIQIANIATGGGCFGRWADIAGFATNGWEIIGRTDDAVERLNRLGRKEQDDEEAAASSASSKDGGTIYANVF